MFSRPLQKMQQQIFEKPSATEISEIKTTTGHDDFCGKFCDLGYDSDLAVTANVDNKCPHPLVTYYVKSLPGVKTVAHDHPMVQTFQAACDEWTRQQCKNKIIITLNLSCFDLVLFNCSSFIIYHFSFQS